MRHLINKALKGIGYKIERFSPKGGARGRASGEKFSRTLSDLNFALSVLISGLGDDAKVCIAQVGANDGRLNDPVFEFAKLHANQTKLLLIEPQAPLIPYLRENYAFHPDTRIENCAVGAKGSLSLFAVNERLWPELRPDYAREWPIYRAPTGVTSGNKDHVARWLRQTYRGSQLPEDAIVELAVPSHGLEDLVREWLPERGRIDLLQIDVETLDDQVLYDCNLASLAPRLINFEIELLPADRKRALLRFLSEQGYSVCSIDRDALAIRSGAGETALEEEETGK